MERNHSQEQRAPMLAVVPDFTMLLFQQRVLVRWKI